MWWISCKEIMDMCGVMLLTFILICLCIELTTSIYGVILNVIINSISILIMLPIIPIENPNKKLDAT